MSPDTIALTDAGPAGRIARPVILAAQPEASTIYDIFFNECDGMCIYTIRPQACQGPDPALERTMRAHLVRDI